MLIIMQILTYASLEIKTAVSRRFLSTYFHPRVTRHDNLTCAQAPKCSATHDQSVFYIIYFLCFGSVAIPRVLCWVGSRQAAGVNHTVSSIGYAKASYEL